MADNIPVTPGSGSIVAADDIGGILHQRVKLVLGADGVNDGDVSSTNPIPVSGSVSVSASALPTGAATAANQTTGNSTLNNIDIKTPSLVSGRVPVDGSGVTQPVSGPLTDAQLRATAVPTSNSLEKAATGTITSVSNATSSFTALASNASRKGFVIVNDSTATVSVAFAATASTTAFTLRLTANASYFSTSLPVYTGIITAIASAATGSLRVTELT